MRVWVVLPAYNEAENLPAIFNQFKKVAEDTYNLSLHVLLVDDGSSDNTPEAAIQSAADIPLEVLRNEKNVGLAETFRRGIIAAAGRAQADDVIVCMDADNSHVPGQILHMVRNIQEGRDAVIASRYQPGAIVKGVPFLRRVLSRGMSLLFRVVYPIKGVRDYSCSYRAYRAGLLQRAVAAQGQRLFATEGFACMVGILLRLDKEGAVFGEVPLVLRYDLKVGASKMKVGSTIIETLLVLLRERLNKN